MGNWDAYPQSEAVHWPSNEKIIGVLGVAPLATADFFQRLCSRPTYKDWEHPRVIIDSNPKIPSRGRCLELGETDPVPYIKSGIAALANCGAEIIALPCNTAHIFYDRYTCDSHVYIPNMIDVVSEYCSHTHTHTQKCLILASKSTVLYGLYQKKLKNFAIESIVPDMHHQDCVSSWIESVKQYRCCDDAAHEMLNLILSSNADSVILGCTELSLLYKRYEAEVSYALNKRTVSIIDSNQVLADHCLKCAQGI